MSYRSSVNLGLPNISEPPDPAFFGEFTRVYNAVRNLAVALDAYTGKLQEDSLYFSQRTPESSVLVGNLNRLYVIAGADLVYGNIIQLYNDAGTLKAQKATALTSATLAHGVWNVTSTLTGVWGECILWGLTTAIGGLTPGARYYLGDTAGTISATPGTRPQKLGVALSATEFFLRPDLV